MSFLSLVDDDESVVGTIPEAKTKATATETESTDNNTIGDGSSQNNTKSHDGNSYVLDCENRLT